MLSREQLDKINQYLCYLACGVKENGLSKEDEREVLNLACRCLDEIDEIENKPLGILTDNYRRN